MGLTLSGLSTILGGVNFITTIFCMRAPGMTMFRMPIFTWNALLTSILALLAFPVLAAALLVLEIDRKLGAHVFDASSGGALLWQNLFWFFGHPEVYIVALPFFGIITEVLPVFSRKPLFGYKSLIGATIAIAGLSMTVWAHHMFTTGAVLLPFFSFMTFLIAVPTGVKFFNWTGTIWRGQLTFEPAMLFASGSWSRSCSAGSPGSSWPRRRWTSTSATTYFVVAHFHYVLFGTVVFAMFSGFYFWWPKMTGKMLDSRLGKWHFWTLFLGFHGTFLVQHWLGVIGMPRRIATLPRPAGDRDHAERRLQHQLVRPRRLHVLLPLQRVQDGALRRAGHGRRPVGPRQLAGVGDVLPAAPAQLHQDPADQVRAARVRPALPAGQTGPGLAGGQAVAVGVADVERVAAALGLARDGHNQHRGGSG